MGSFRIILYVLGVVFLMYHIYRIVSYYIHVLGVVFLMYHVYRIVSYYIGSYIYICIIDCQAFRLRRGVEPFIWIQESHSQCGCLEIQVEKGEQSHRRAFLFICTPKFYERMRLDNLWSILNLDVKMWSRLHRLRTHKAHSTVAFTKARA